MRLGIVGHGADKFTPATEALAKEEIRAAIREHSATVVVSGHSPLGGIDIWAEQIGDEMGLLLDIKRPKAFSWGAPGGYKDRNLEIAHDSDLVVCIVVADWPEGFKGVRYVDYHCKGRNPPHVKSGGCWTAWKCARREWRII